MCDNLGKILYLCPMYDGWWVRKKNGVSKLCYATIVTPKGFEPSS